MHLLLVGAGYMAKEYAKVLIAKKIPFEIIGRSEEKCSLLSNELQKPIISGGLENSYDKVEKFPTHAIVASSLSDIENNTIFLLERGVKNILIEKPGATTLEGIQRIATLTKKKKAKVFIAYNRRFYSSVLEAKKRIEMDGGLKSMVIEFTEWAHILKDLKKNQSDLSNWFIANSTHVLDTAFYFGGKPKEMSSYVQSKLDWHPSGSVYAGAGITEKDILFSYHANWTSPGSWKLELLTDKNRYIFRPFEELHVQQLGELVVQKVEIDDSLDKEYKPGLSLQVEEFCEHSECHSELLDINTAMQHFKIYSAMQLGGYQNE